MLLSSYNLTVLFILHQGEGKVTLCEESDQAIETDFLPFLWYRLITMVGKRVGLGGRGPIFLQKAICSLLILSKAQMYIPIFALESVTACAEGRDRRGMRVAN